MKRVDVVMDSGKEMMVKDMMRRLKARQMDVMRNLIEQQMKEQAERQVCIV